MTAQTLMTTLAAALVGFAVASAWTARRLKSPPPSLMRTNVNGNEVPAILGEPVAVAGTAALVAVVLSGAVGWEPARLGELGAAVALVVIVMAFAGRWDDRRGDEEARGFRGHLRELKRARLSGGLLKIAAGIVAGSAAGLVLWGDDALRVATTVLLVAGGANVVNLFDRAPGRAGKVVLAIGLPLMVFGTPAWAIGAAGAMGALVAVLPIDLAEKAMLGDEGANPLGALLGLGLAVSLEGWSLWGAVATVLLLNAAAERWSFSQLIQSSRFLDSLDRAGRK